MSRLRSGWEFEIPWAAVRLDQGGISACAGKGRFPFMRRRFVRLHVCLKAVAEELSVGRVELAQLLLLAGQTANCFCCRDRSTSTGLDADQKKTRPCNQRACERWLAISSWPRYRNPWRPRMAPRMLPDYAKRETSIISLYDRHLPPPSRATRLRNSDCPAPGEHGSSSETAARQRNRFCSHRSSSPQASQDVCCRSEKDWGSAEEAVGGVEEEAGVTQSSAFILAPLTCHPCIRALLERS